MGLVNLAGPFLKRHNIALPALDIASLLHRGDRDKEGDLDTILSEDVAEDGEAAPGRSLLARRRLGAGTDDDGEELDDELAGVLEEVAAEEIVPPVDDELVDDAEESPVVYRVPAGADELEGDGEDSAEQQDVLGALDEAVASEIEGEDESDDQNDEADDDPAEDESDDQNDEADDDPAEDELDDQSDEADDEDEEEADDEDDDEDEEEDDEDDEEDEDEEEASGLKTVSAGGNEGDDMMSFFDEAAGAGAGAVAAWHEDLPQVSIEDLLEEARAMSQQIKGKKSDAA